MKVDPVLALVSGPTKNTYKSEKVAIIKVNNEYVQLHSKPRRKSSIRASYYRHEVTTRNEVDIDQTSVLNDISCSLLGVFGPKHLALEGGMQTTV